MKENVLYSEFFLKIGTEIKQRYFVENVLGYGGFGVTYLCRDELLDRIVAVKEYLPTEFSTRINNSNAVTVFTGEKETQFSQGLDKFVEEAKRLAVFDDVPWIVRIFDCFKENNTAYIIMEYISGQCLRDIIEDNQRIEPKEAMQITYEVLEGLKKVHSVGIIHRDISPDNIMIDMKSQVKIIDFGAARNATTTYSKSLSVVLKRGYAPIEQYRSKGEQGPWTDVYGIAATLYKMLTGITPPDVMDRVIKDRIVPPRSLKIKVSKEIEKALLNGLNIDIKMRPQSAEDFSEMLGAKKVKRIKEKKRKEDIGKISLKMKAVIGCSVAVVATMLFLLVSGYISFSVKDLTNGIIVQKARVPNLINLKYNEAEILLEEQGFSIKVESRVYTDETQSGIILDQAVKKGRRIEKGTEIGVTVSHPIEYVQLPNLVNQNYEEVSSFFSENDIKEELVYEASDEAPGLILSQMLREGKSIKKGSTFSMTVSQGRNFDTTKEIVLPDCYDKDVNEVKQQMLDSGIYLYAEEYVYDDNVEEEKIVSQSPAAGARVNGNSVVKVIVSKGREQFEVPNFVGLSETEAIELGKSNQLELNITYVVGTAEDVGKVISQSDEAGTRVPNATVIELQYVDKQEMFEGINAKNISAGDVISSEVTINFGGLWPQQWISVITKDGRELGGMELSEWADRNIISNHYYIIVNPEYPCYVKLIEFNESTEFFHIILQEM